MKYMARILIALPILAGCQSTRLTLQGQGLRDMVRSIYSDQLMDSLVRAKNDQPFVLLRLHDMAVEEMDVAALSATFGDQGVDMHNLALGGAPGLTNARTVTGGYSMTPSVSRSARMSFQADPIAHDDLYEEIRAFAKSSVQSDPNPPDRRDILEETLKHYDGEWYFVSRQNADQFSRLMIRAFTSQPDAPKDYIEVTVTTTAAESEGAAAPATQPAYFTFKFDQPVPNDSGFIVFQTAREGMPTRVNLYPLGTSTGIKLGDPTDRLVAVNVTQANAALFTGAKGRLYLTRIGGAVRERSRIEDTFQKILASQIRDN